MTPLPFGVKLCRMIIGLAAYLVPLNLRSDWIREWQAKLWHQWQFLHHLEAWNRREEWWLVQRSLRAIPHAVSLWWMQEEVQRFQRRWLGSPWTPLLVIGASLLLVAGISGGLPATKLLFTAKSDGNSRELFILLHPVTGGGDKPLPADVLPPWRQGSLLLEKITPFVLTRRRAVPASGRGIEPLVIETDSSLFEALNARPIAGAFPTPASAPALVIDYQTAERLAQLNRRVLGSRMRVNNGWFPVAAVLPQGFHFLTRQPVALLVHQSLPQSAVMVVARVKPGVTKSAIDRELTRIAEDKTYYFFASQLRLRFEREAILLPVSLFGIAALLSGLFTLGVCGFRMRETRRNWTGAHSRWALRRVAYFLFKTSCGLLFVFVAGLEFCRTSSSILLSSKDPANGPFLLWLYIAGTMAVYFWSVADGRVRCRICLQRLCSPVRVGSPGCLLLNWSGTELICTRGHGVLHVPDMTTSWESDSEHWISMDESWKELFASEKHIS